MYIVAIISTAQPIEHQFTTEQEAQACEQALNDQGHVTCCYYVKPQLVRYL